MFTPMGGTAGAHGRSAAKGAEWIPIMPVPADAPAPPAGHPTRGRPARVETYRDAAGAVLGYVFRCDRPDGGKEFPALTWCRNADTGQCAWRWKGFPTPRPLYGLDRLAERPDAPVIVCEGEKAADAAARLLPDHAAVTSPGGAKAASHAQWGALARRHVVIWPDADEPGAAYAGTVARACLAVAAASVAIVDPPAGVPAGWDAADALARGWDQPRALALVQAARPAPADRGDRDRSQGARGNGAGRRDDGPPQRDMVLALADGVELWHTPEREAYATVPIDGHRESWPVDSRDFKLWLTLQFYRKHGGAPGGQSLEDAARVLAARAIGDGAEHKAWLRVGEHDGAIFLDLGDPTWRAVKIAPSGWGLIDEPPLRFRRSPHMRPLPEPERGASIDALRSFVNVATDAQFYLVVAWLIAALRPSGPYPMLVINGEQGSGKSSAAEMLRNLCDPSTAPIRAAPRDERDLQIAAYNAHAIAYDNLSGVPEWLSDGLCRIATGAGFATRALHTDRDEMILSAARPISINGIPDLASRPDLADRALTIQLRSVPATERRTERDVKADFEATRPAILGALLDGVSAALRYLPETRLERLPRMADFAQFVTAAERGLGWEPGTFLPIYEMNRADAVDTVLENDPVAQAVLAMFASGRESWEGTPSGLLAELGTKVPEQVRKSRAWPQTASRLGTILNRLAPPLRLRGIGIERAKVGSHNDARRMIFITSRQPA